MNGTCLAEATSTPATRRPVVGFFTRKTGERRGSIFARDGGNKAPLACTNPDRRTVGSPRGVHDRGGGTSGLSRSRRSVSNGMGSEDTFHAHRGGASGFYLVATLKVKCEESREVESHALSRNVTANVTPRMSRLLSRQHKRFCGFAAVSVTLCHRMSRQPSRARGDSTYERGGALRHPPLLSQTKKDSVTHRFWRSNSASRRVALEALPAQLRRGGQ